jgi:drug/metabolite transporter (DMT)-like permease
MLWRSELSELLSPLASAAEAVPRRAKLARNATRIFLLIDIRGSLKVAFEGSPPPKGVARFRTERLFHRLISAKNDADEGKDRPGRLVRESACTLREAGRSSAWSECCLWEAEVASSNLAAPILVVILAASSALFFGALAVTIRLALARGIDVEAASLVTTVLAGVICAGLALATGDFGRAHWGGTWPFFVTGLFAPGISQILFTRSVGVIGPSRTAIVVGISPVLSAAIAVTLLGEPLHVALVVGTLLVVAGGTLLASERRGPVRLLSLGIAFSLGAALLFSIRDNLVRWAARGSEVPGFVAATASLASATFVIGLVVLSKPNARERMRVAVGPFIPSGLVYGISYACLYSAFDRGRVTVVAPLVATESLFAVLISIVLLRRSESIGPRLLLAAALVVGGGALISGFR